jgi:hypothetical protein
MSSTASWRTASGMMTCLVCFLLVVWSPHPVCAADPEVEALRAMIDGMYALEEWHTDTGVFRPPQVEGRFTALHGAVVLVLHNRISEANQTTNASYGSYVLNAKEFAYRYEAPSVFTQTSTGITVSHKPFWEGLRSFAVSRDGEAVLLRSATGEEFLFSREGLKYSQQGKVLRVWRRLPSRP